MVCKGENESRLENYQRSTAIRLPSAIQIPLSRIYHRLHHNASSLHSARPTVTLGVSQPASRSQFDCTQEYDPSGFCGTGQEERFVTPIQPGRQPSFSTLQLMAVDNEAKQEALTDRMLWLTSSVDVLA